MKAQGNFGMVYVGGIFDYISGDDPDTLDTMEGGITKLLRAGDDYMPCLLLWNSWYGSTSVPNALNVSGAAGAGYTTGAFGITNDVTTFEDNVWMYQLYFGVKPTPKTDVKLSVTYAYADKKPTATAFLVPDAIGTIAGIPNPYFEGKKYGWEVDLTASYKIFDNLTYTVGGAYHFVGDYFKGPTTRRTTRPTPRVLLAGAEKQLPTPHAQARAVLLGSTFIDPFATTPRGNLRVFY